MKEDFKYLIYVLFAIIVIGILPNLILKPIWSELLAAPTVFLNAFLIPISLLRVIRLINKKFDKEWWILNFALIFVTVCLSVYLGFLNWANWVDKTPGGWGSDNIDKGTYMIINLELMLGLGIVGIAFLIKIITKIGEWRSKTYS